MMGQTVVHCPLIITFIVSCSSHFTKPWPYLFGQCLILLQNFRYVRCHFFMMFKHRQTIFHKEKMFILCFPTKRSNVAMSIPCWVRSVESATVMSFHPKETSICPQIDHKHLLFKRLQVHQTVWLQIAAHRLPSGWGEWSSWWSPLASTSGRATWPK